MERRDIKAPNILVDAKNIAYAHDFDLTVINTSIAYPAQYMYWDQAGQLGFATDVVGAILAISELEFDTVFSKDFQHKALSGGFDQAYKKLLLPNLPAEIPNYNSEQKLISFLDSTIEKETNEKVCEPLFPTFIKNFYTPV